MRENFPAMTRMKGSQYTNKVNAQLKSYKDIIKFFILSKVFFKIGGIRHGVQLCHQCFITVAYNL